MTRPRLGCAKAQRVAPTTTAMLQTLKIAWAALNFCVARGRHCTNVERHATAMASAALISATATRMKGRLTDIFPVSPGSLTFKRAARLATKMKEAKRTCSAELACAKAFASTARPDSTTTAKNIFEVEDALLCIRLAPVRNMLFFLLATYLRCWSSDYSSPPVKTFITPDCVELPHITVEPQMTLNPACVLSPQMTDAPQITD